MCVVQGGGAVPGPPGPVPRPAARPAPLLGRPGEAGPPPRALLLAHAPPPGAQRTSGRRHAPGQCCGGPAFAFEDFYLFFYFILFLVLFFLFFFLFVQNNLQNTKLQRFDLIKSSSVFFFFFV